jgi:ketosteroid isomerase-like protein
MTRRESLTPTLSRNGRGRHRPPTIALGWIVLSWLAVDAGAQQAPGIDMDAEQAAVLAADLAYQRAAKSRDRQAFHALLAPDAVFFGDRIQRGRIDYVAGWAPLFEGKYGFHYRGEPLAATVARSGELAWSLGDVETSFTPPGSDEPTVVASQYMTVWTRGEDGWKVAASASLVVHPELGSARDPRTGLMTAWPELADQIDAAIEIEWLPETTVRAASGELAWTLGEYRAEFRKAGTVHTGRGAFVAVWQKDGEGRWQLAAEGFTPPDIYRP